MGCDVYNLYFTEKSGEELEWLFTIVFGFHKHVNLFSRPKNILVREAVWNTLSLNLSVSTWEEQNIWCEIGALFSRLAGARKTRGIWVNEIAQEEKEFSGATVYKEIRLVVSIVDDGENNSSKRTFNRIRI